MKYQYLIGSVMSVYCVMAATAAPAATTIYTDRAAFNAATTNQVITDFEALRSGSTQSNPFSGTDFTLSANSGLLISMAPGGIPNYDFNSGKVLSLFKLNDTSGSFTPAAGVTAFGFDYGVLAGSNTNVTINGTNYTAGAQPTLNFFGIVDSSGVAPISFSFLASRAIFDNVTVATARPMDPPPVPGAVPEPATWAMMLFGFGAIGSAVRRQQRVRVRFA